METTTYSFDVFDTCLCRLCGDGRNVFDVLSLKVQRLMGENASENMRQLFVAERANAGGGSLEAVYQQVAARFPLPCSVAEMIQLELETEQEMLSPIVSTRKMIENIRASIGMEGGGIIYQRHVPAR